MYFNWIDIVIIAFVLYYIVEGWEVGIWKQGVGLISFLGSLWLAVRYHLQAGSFVSEKFGVSAIWSQVIGYAVVAILAELLISEFLFVGVNQLPKNILTSKVNKWLGAVLSAAKALVVVTLGLILFSVLPLRGTVAADINNSKIGRVLITLTEKYAGGVKASLNQTAKDVVRFLTVRPQSTETVSLEDALPTKLALSVDQASESHMVKLVNDERVKED